MGKQFVIDEIQGWRLEMDQTVSTSCSTLEVGLLARHSFSFVILKTLI